MCVLLKSHQPCVSAALKTSTHVTGLHSQAEALGALQPAPAVLPAAQATLSETSGSLAHIMASSAAGTEAPESSNAAQRPPATPRRIRKPAPSVRQVRVSPAKLTGTSGQAVAHVRSKQHTENRGEGAFNQQGAELSSRERGAMPASHPASPSDPKRQEAAAGLQASPFQAGSEPLQRPAAAGLHVFCLEQGLAINRFSGVICRSLSCYPALFSGHHQCCCLHVSFGTGH